MVIYLAEQLLGQSCNLPVYLAPGQGAPSKLRRYTYLVLLLVGFAMRILLLASRWALTPPFHHYCRLRSSCIFSVALSLGSPPLDVIQHHCPVKPGLSSISYPMATIRSSAVKGYYSRLLEHLQFLVDIFTV